MAMLLMQWSQYYHTSYSNPYNQPYLLHVGMPKDVSDEYYNQFDLSTVMSACRHSLDKATQYRNLGKIDTLYFKRDKCEEVECKLRDICSGYKVFSALIEQLDENYEIAEGITGILWEWWNNNDDDEVNYRQISDDIETIAGEWINYENPDFENIAMQFLIGYISQTIGKSGNCYLYDFLVNKELLDKVLQVEKEKPKDENNMAEFMRSWAQSSNERRN